MQQLCTRPLWTSKDSNKSTAPAIHNTVVSSQTNLLFCTWNPPPRTQFRAKSSLSINQLHIGVKETTRLTRSMLSKHQQGLTQSDPITYPNISSRIQYVSAAEIIYQK